MLQKYYQHVPHKGTTLIYSYVYHEFGYFFFDITMVAKGKVIELYNTGGTLLVQKITQIIYKSETRI